MSVMLFKEQYNRLMNVITNSDSPDEFEYRWTNVMETTELRGNEWLSNMYLLRSRWVTTYVKHVFAARMSSSQRSENNHAFFKRYVHMKNSLKDFITCFNGVLAHQRHEELIANHTDLNEHPRLTTAFVMENQMARIYTKTIFPFFQDELAQSTHYIFSKKSSSDGVKTYVVERFDPGKMYDRQRELTYSTASDFISCSCRLFEFDGYLCRLMLSLMMKKQVRLLPDTYIVRRWTKNAKVINMYEPSVEFRHGYSLISRHGMLAHTASGMVDKGTLTDACTTFLMDGFQNLLIRVEDIDDGGNVGMSKNKSKSSEETQLVLDPIPVRTKGCGKRLKSGKEKAMSQPNRNCSTCAHPGHDKRTCPNKQNKCVDH